jgi:polar amino acid transport system substrate-binding protein
MHKENLLAKNLSDLRRLLAPTGALRVGLYPGSPNSFIRGIAPEQDKGVGYELGRALAQRLDIEFKPVFYTMNGDVLAAAKEHQVDFLLANATAPRATYLAFTQPVLRIEQGYLVGANVNIDGADAIDQQDLTIGVSAGSTSESVLPKILKHARIISVKNLQDAADKLRASEIQAFATNKAILFELSDQLTGSNVLKGAWGIENISIGIPLERHAALPCLQTFADDMHTNLFIKQAAARAGLRGLTTDHDL